MKNKRVVVALKFFKGELNPFDGAALECALESGAKEIVVLAMAPFAVKEQLQSLTRLGVRAVLVSDKLYAGSDTIATSRVLAEAIKRLDPEIVYCGRQSVDGDTAQVPPMLAERLGFSLISKVMETDGASVTTRSGERFVPENKTIVTFERIRTLRFPSIFSKVGETEVWDNSVLNIPEKLCGQAGSPTRVVKAYENTQGRRSCQFVALDELDEIIRQSLRKEERKIEKNAAEKLPEGYFVGDVEEKAATVAEKTYPIESEGKTAKELAEEILKKGARAVFWEDDDKRKILASRVAAILSAGLCADCISFRAQEGKLVMTRPAQGGNITADIVADSEIAMATVRTPKKGGNEIVVTVGKGGAAFLPKIRAFAERYEAEFCCTRIVADGGKMPYETQVGLTGKTVAPKVYVAFGVSGAVQHTCAIENAGTVIAVNSDKNARIFDYADYGIVADIDRLR